MNGRFVSILTGVLVLTGAIAAQGQAPIFMPGAGPAPYQEAVQLWYPPSTPQPSGDGWQPWTPPYQAGPANRSWDNLSGDRGWNYENSPLDEFLADLTKNSFVRFEYLLWNFRDPGSSVLGAPVLGQVNPTVPFQVTNTGGVLAGEARVPTTTNIDLNETQGIRGTLGIPIAGGTIEASIFHMEEVVDGEFIDDLGDPGTGDPLDLPQFVATSTFSGTPGTTPVLGNNLFIYDDSYRSELAAELWGSELNYVFEPYLPESWLQIRPIVGFRYADYDEDFRQVGVFDQQDNLATPLVSRINSRTENRVYVPQIGLRAELTSRWLTIGVEPKFGVGVNVFQDFVSTQSLRSPGDPFTPSTESGEKIAATGELSVYARVHFRQNFTVGVGYSITFIDNISRAHNSIFYNDNGQAEPPAIVVDPQFELMDYGGLNVYGEMRF